jgi:hypothetical protein
MTGDTEPSYRLGTGKYRLGSSTRLTVEVGDEQKQMLDKLRLVKGYHSSEVVQIALESLFSQPLAELDHKMKKKRGHF